jgi:hypothetical protein
MKRILLPLAFVACAAACAPAPSNTANTNANMSNMNAANTNMGAATWTNDDVITNEKQAWDAIKSKDPNFGAMLADNFINVTPTGVLDKAGTVAEVKTFDLTDVSLSDFKVVKLDNDAAVVAYTVKLKGKVGGKDIPANAPGERHGTAKVWRGGKWLAVFHQVTPIEPAPPMPAPTKSAANANSANANSANANGASARNSNGAGDVGGSATLATTADVEANEKLVWDAFEKKNIAGFESILADDAFEVEPEATYDKAASVSMMKQMVNAAPMKGTLSDFKTVTLDDDAKIATYVAKSSSKGFPPSGMRHSTVWINRGGKWMAAYHQGTTIMQAPPGK